MQRGSFKSYRFYYFEEHNVLRLISHISRENH